MSEVTPSGAPEAQDTLRSVVVAPERDDDLARALRTGIVRRPGQGHIAGVCAALAAGWGMPARLVRLLALLLLGLGIGLPLYLVFMLVLPREEEAGADPGGAPRVQRPLARLMRGRMRPGDGLLALAVVPAAILALIWLYALAAILPTVLWLAVPVLLLLLIVVRIGAVRAQRARTGYVIAQLAEQAGVIDPEELQRTLAELRRSAPWAWAEAPAGRAARGADPRGSRQGRPMPQVPRRLSPRATMIGVAILLITGTGVFVAVSLVPGIAPGMADAEPLPGIGRGGAAAAAMTLAAGVMLMIVGWKRRRSLALSLIGVLAFSGLAASVVWVRLTDGSTSDPIIVSVDSYQPGYTPVCGQENPRDWSRTVVIDMSRMTPPESLDEVRKAAEAYYGSTDAGTPIAMDVQCDRPVGNVEVILPRGVTVASTLSTSLGSQHGDVPPVSPLWSAGAIVVNLDGDLWVGDITYRKAGS